MLPRLSAPPRAARALNWTSHSASRSGKSGTESPICPHEVSSPWAALSSHTANDGESDRSMISGVQDSQGGNPYTVDRVDLVGSQFGSQFGCVQGVPQVAVFAEPALQRTPLLRCTRPGEIGNRIGVDSLTLCPENSTQTCQTLAIQ
jgi:hypothetical protein